MERKDLFSIGEVSRLFHISVSSLRYYEHIGLLVPEAVAEGSGYRYYGTEQFEALNTIRYLRALDMPLSEIADFLGNRDVCRIEEKLRQQKTAVIKKQQALKQIERKIDNRLKQLQTAQNAELDRVELVQMPACRMVWMEDSLEIRGFLDMEKPIRRLEQENSEAVVFLGKVGLGISAEHLKKGLFTRYDRIFLILDEEDRFGGEACLLPEIRCARVRFRGSHAEAPAQYERLMAYLRAHALTPAGFSREVTMIDYGITGDRNKFVTELSIPVTC